MIKQINMKFIISMLRGYTGQRLLTAGLVFACALLAAWVLGPALYGQIFLVMFIAKLLLLGNLGSISGYMHGFYKAEQPPPDSGNFLISYGMHLSLFACVAIVVGFLVGKVYFLGAICFALLLPFFLVEPVLRVKRLFFISLLPDWVLNLSLLVGLFYYLFYGSQGNDLEGIIFVFLLALGFFSGVFLFLINWRWGLGRRLALARPMVNYIKLLRIGLPLFAGTAAFSLFLFVDRFFLERYHSAESLGVYMLAFQLATGATLILTSLNFTASVDYGELIKQKKPLGNFIVRRLRQALFVSAVSVLVLLVGAYILQQYFFQEYYGLIYAALSLGVGLCGFYAAGSVTPIAFYLNKQVFLMKAMFVIVILAISGNIYVVSKGLGYIWISFFSGCWLLSYAFVAVRYVFRLDTSCASLFRCD